MDRLTDADIAGRILDAHLKHRPAIARQTMTDPVMSMQLKMFRAFLAITCTAARSNGVGYDQTCKILGAITVAAFATNTTPEA